MEGVPPGSTLVSVKSAERKHRSKHRDWDLCGRWQSLGRVFRTGCEYQGNLNQGWRGRDVALANEGQDVAGTGTGSPRWWEPCSGGDTQLRDWQRTKTMTNASMALKWSFMNYYVNSNKIQMLIVLQPFRHQLLLAASFASWFKLSLFLHLWELEGLLMQWGEKWTRHNGLSVLGNFQFSVAKAERTGKIWDNYYLQCSVWNYGVN